MADETPETDNSILDDDVVEVVGDEIKVDDEASFAQIAAAHAAAITEDKTVSVEGDDDEATASSGGTVVAAAAAEVRPKMGRKVREGLVASNKMDKTAIVVARDRVRHRRYNKTVQRDKRLYVHDENNELNVGDRVRVIETRPLSKNKRWRLLEVLEQAR